MAILFVDKKSKNENGEIAITIDRSVVLLNLKIIGDGYAAEFTLKAEKASGEFVFDTCICGRYMSLIWLSTTKGEMIFIDSENDYLKAEKMYDILGKDGKLKNRFIKLFEMLSPDYDKYYNDVELRLYSEFKNYASSLYS